MHAAWLQSPFVNSKAVRETRTSSLRAGHLGVNWPTHIQGMERGVRGYLVSFFSLPTRLSGVGMFCIYAGIPVRFCCSRKRMQNAGMLDDGGVRAQGGWEGREASVTHCLTNTMWLLLWASRLLVASRIRVIACVLIGQSQVVCGWARKFEGDRQRAREKKSSNTKHSGRTARSRAPEKIASCGGRRPRRDGWEKSMIRPRPWSCVEMGIAMPCRAVLFSASFRLVWSLSPPERASD